MPKQNSYRRATISRRATSDRFRSMSKTEPGLLTGRALYASLPGLVNMASRAQSANRSPCPGSPATLRLTAELFFERLHVFDVPILDDSAVADMEQINRAKIDELARCARSRERHIGGYVTIGNNVAPHVTA